LTDLRSLHEKVVVITGGTRGIGLALARTLAAEGCKVIVTGRKTGNLQAALAKPGDGEISAFSCDVTQPSAVQEFFHTLQQRYAAIDVLINNAGAAHALASVEKLSLETWQRVINTNLTGMFLCCQAALPLMRTGATIVNNLSVAATTPFPGMAAYNASKAGALGFTNVLREELRKQGIRVLALMPGATDTDIWGQFWPNAPREKMISANTVAEAVLHVLKLPPEATIEEIRLGPSAGVL
jgi:NAD(P)-dependent dehydrogenase (short-subunit alcohol dehydrogenase family)